MSLKAGDPSRKEALKLFRAQLTLSEWLKSAGQEYVSTQDICGRVSAENVAARRAVPHYRAAAMDGIAVRSVDTACASSEQPARLNKSFAIDGVQAGEACVVDTGDVVPDGADSVVMREHIRFEGSYYFVSAPVASGRHIREKGEDICEGQNLIEKDVLLGPTEVAACLAAGVEKVTVYNHPRVSIIPSGDELVDSPEQLAPGQIRDVNSHMLKALVESWGGIVRRFPVVKDNFGQLCEVVSSAVRDSDMVILNAGTSKGTDDYSARVLSELGNLVVHGVAIRPGRPVVLAVVDGKPVIGLPGYPASCLLTAHLFVRDLLIEWQHLPARNGTQNYVRLACDIPSQTGLEEYLRVTVKGAAGNFEAVPLPRGASLLSSLTAADGWIRIAADQKELHKGDMVALEFARPQFANGFYS